MAIRTVYFPDDLLTDILSRLPVKSLVRFRLVCKSWRSLLKTHDFTNAQLKRSASHGCRLLVHSPEKDHVLLNETLDVGVKIESPSAEEKDGVLVGSCNGLVCLFRDWMILLWNPATREDKILPTPHINPPFPNPSVMKVSIGFGFHLNDYKVVRIVYLNNQDGRSVPAKVEVYSTGTDSWRVIKAVVPSKIERRSCSVIVKGVPYWLGFGPFFQHTRFESEEVCRDEFVLSFDMGNEVFRQVSVPRADCSSKKLGVFNESLAIIYYHLGFQAVNNVIDIWVMKDYGVDECCWSKVVTIGPFPCLRRPLGCWENGVVIWQNIKDELVLYDPNIKGIKNLLGCCDSKSCSVSTYMESLVRVRRE